MGPDGSLWFTEPNVNKIGQLYSRLRPSVSALTGSYRTPLTFTGSAFEPNEAVQTYVQDVGSTILASATADATGSFTATVHEPQSVHGPRLFQGAGQSSGKLGAASFSVLGRVAPSPASGSAGSAVVASGYHRDAAFQ